MLPTLNAVTAGGGLPLPEYVKLAFVSGFSGVDFSITQAQDYANEHGFPALAAIFENHKVLPASFGLPVEWRKDEDTFQRGLSELPALAKLAQDMECFRCTTWVLPDGGIPVQEYADRSLRRFFEIARILSSEGVRFGLEFIGPKHLRPNEENVWFYDIPGALKVVDEIHYVAGVQNCGLLVDCWHWHTSGGTPMDLASIPVEQVIHVHVNDAPQGVARDDLLDNVRELPGTTGEIDIVAFLRTLNAIGYDGPVAVETFSERLKTLSPEQAAREADETLRRCFAAADVEPLRLV